ncbi:MAG: hypothetical protein ABIA37_02370 [Candidatus Woesearchaeota archaeon]
MKIEIREKRENKLLNRIEVEGKVFYEGVTPSNEVLKEALAAELKADKKLTVVKHIYPKFSHHEADFLTVAYQDKTAMDNVEVLTKHKKKKLEEEKKKAEEARKKEQEAKEVAAKEEQVPPSPSKAVTEEKKKETPSEKKEGGE